MEEPFVSEPPAASVETQPVTQQQTDSAAEGPPAESSAVEVEKSEDVLNQLPAHESSEAQ
jgi:hypothetical protein